MVVQIWLAYQNYPKNHPAVHKATQNCSPYLSHLRLVFMIQHQKRGWAKMASMSFKAKPIVEHSPALIVAQMASGE